MVRPIDWHPASDRDPVPGDVESARELARRAQTMVDAIQAATTGLRRIEVAGTSLAMDSFRAMTGDAQVRVAQVEPRYSALATSARRWADDLEGLQSRANVVLARARTAEDNRLTGTRLLANAADPEGRLRAERLVAEAVAAIRTERLNADDLHTEWDSAGRAYFSTLDRVISGDKVKDGFWDNVASFVADVAGISSKLSAALGVAALAVAWIPVVGQPAAGLLGTVSLGFAAVSLVANLGLKASGQGGSWGEIGWATFTIATFGVARAAGSLAQTTTLGARAMTRVGAVRALRAEGLTHAQAVARVQATLGAADGATPAALAAAREAARPSLGEAAKLGFGGLKSGVTDDLAQLRQALRDPGDIAAGFRGYGEGGREAILARITGAGSAADEVGRAKAAQGALDDAGLALRAVDETLEARLLRSGLIDVQVASGAAGLSGIKDLHEVDGWIRGDNR